MKKLSLHYFTADAEAANRLATELKIPACPIQLHKFPDGEGKVRVTPVEGTAIIYASLNTPNDKLIYLAFAANALRESAADRVILVAPYLCYMRQDTAFNVGEAISQKVIGAYLSIYFDRLITVDPHTHRVDDLQEVFPDCKVDTLSASMLIAETIGSIENQKSITLVGPDSESKQWVGAIADQVSLPFVVAEKLRRDDRDVDITFYDKTDIVGKHTFIIDDIISSGTTIIKCAKALTEMGALSVSVFATHALCSEADLDTILLAGVDCVHSTDSIPHSTNSIQIARLLAEALREEWQ